jgi:hypothetical protein
MGAVGLEGLFLWYRRARRRVQHSGVRLNIAGGSVRPKQIKPR